MPLHTGTRRQLLATAGSAASLCVAGCLGGDGAVPDSDSDETNETDDGLDDRVDDDLDEEDFDDDLGAEDDHGQGDYDVDVSELLIYDADDEEVANSHAGHWHYETKHGGLPRVDVGSTMELEPVFTKAGEELSLEDDEPYGLDVVIADGASDDVVDVDVGSESVSLSGRDPGETATVFRLVEGDELAWESPSIETVVEP